MVRCRLLVAICLLRQFWTRFETSLMISLVLHTLFVINNNVG